MRLRAIFINNLMLSIFQGFPQNRQRAPIKIRRESAESLRADIITTLPTAVTSFAPQNLTPITTATLLQVITIISVQYVSDTPQVMKYIHVGSTSQSVIAFRMTLDK